MNEFPSHKIINFKQLFLVVELQASRETPCNILLDDNFLELSRRDSKKLRNVTGSRKNERKRSPPEEHTSCRPWTLPLLVAIFEDLRCHANCRPKHCKLFDRSRNPMMMLIP